MSTCTELSETYRLRETRQFGGAPEIDQGGQYNAAGRTAAGFQGVCQHCAKSSNTQGARIVRVGCGVTVKPKAKFEMPDSESGQLQHVLAARWLFKHELRDRVPKKAYLVSSAGYCLGKLRHLCGQELC